MLGANQIMTNQNDVSVNSSAEKQYRSLETDLASQLKFQQRWRVISMSAYVVTTIGTLVCTAGGTYYAASGASKLAAILAAIATILVGVEKSLLFREKWKFHLLMYTKLNALRAKFLLSRLTPAEASDEFTSIMTLYASELPMSAREQS